MFGNIIAYDFLQNLCIFTNMETGNNALGCFDIGHTESVGLRSS